jgi:hypothetical protein
VFAIHNEIISENDTVSKGVFAMIYKTTFCTRRANGLRYLRWGGDGEAVQPEKC